MTGSNDLDRLLGAYLDDGPRRSPDRPVDAAIAFARAHPRRRDPLGFLKPDVMARRSAMASPQLAWAALFVVLTLGAVAAVVVGSRPTDAPVVPPPTVIESPAPTSAPSTPPTPSPSPRAFNVVITDENDVRHPVEVVDLSGRLVAVDAGPIVSEEMPADAVVRNEPEVESGLYVAWAYVGCDDATTVTIDRTLVAITVERPACGGDTLGGNPLQVTLRFDGAVDADVIEVGLNETP